MADRAVLRRAEVLSTTGAVVVGAGGGLLFERWLLCWIAMAAVIAYGFIR